MRIVSFFSFEVLLLLFVHGSPSSRWPKSSWLEESFVVSTVATLVNLCVRSERLVPTVYYCFLISLCLRWRRVVQRNEHDRVRAGRSSKRHQSQRRCWTFALVWLLANHGRGTCSHLKQCSCLVCIASIVNIAHFL